MKKNLLKKLLYKIIIKIQKNLKIDFLYYYYLILIKIRSFLI